MRLTSGRTEIALHELRADAGPTLLCLHALRGQAADFAELAPAWPGRVLALDFAGHGASGRPRGGSYTPELLAGDVDAALDQIEQEAHAQTDMPTGQTASRSRAKTRGPAAGPVADRAAARDLPGAARGHRAARVGRADLARARQALRSARRPPSRRRPPRGLAAGAARRAGGDGLHGPGPVLPAALRRAARLGRRADQPAPGLGDGAAAGRASVPARGAAAAARRARGPR